MVRGFPILLPFLAGVAIGPLFFNGFGGNQNKNCNSYYCPQPVMPYYQPIYQNQVFYPYYG